MKLPNRFGSITKLKGSRRNPWVAKKFDGYATQGHAKYKVVGYYPTREEALKALSLYNADPWNVEQQNMTVAALYELWREKRMPKLGKSNQQGLRSAWKHCGSVAQTKYRDLRAYDVQECIDNCGYGHATQNAIKGLFYHLDRFAAEQDMSSKKCSALLTVAPAPPSTGVPFTDAEVAALWKISGDMWVDMALVMIYAGWRITELLTLEKANITLDDIPGKIGTMKGGIKTEAGRDRIVPIHPKIFDIVNRYHSLGKRYLFETRRGRSMAKATYYKRWDIIMDRIGAAHNCHDCRHTLRTRLDNAGANKTAIDRIMGHTSQGTGERIYTHKAIEELRKALEFVRN